MMFDLVLRGDLVLPDQIIKDGYLAVQGGRIAGIGTGATAPSSDLLDDYSGCLLFPGLVDAQVHAGSVVGTLGLQDATMAAAAGGVTTIVDMPFDRPLPVDNVDALRAKIEQVEALALVDVALYATAPRDLGPDTIRQLAEAGACAIKLSTYEYHPTRFPRTSMGEMLEVFDQAAGLDIPVAFHNEDQEIVQELTRKVKAAGQFGPETHALTRPPTAELVANAQVLELALRTGAKAHIVHSSVAEGYEMAARYRSLGAKVSVETCLQYLTFNEEDVTRQGSPLKQTPPLRPEHERLLLWDALADGKVTILSTDHVAWPLANKSDPDMFNNSSGIPGLETLLPILFTSLVERNLCPTIIANICSLNVARHFCFDDRKGSLGIGKDADVAVVARQAGRFNAIDMLSAEKWSPYDGYATAGKVAATYLRGRKLFADGHLIERQPHGKFVSPLRRERSSSL